VLFLSYVIVLEYVKVSTAASPSVSFTTVIVPLDVPVKGLVVVKLTPLDEAPPDAINTVSPLESSVPDPSIVIVTVEGDPVQVIFR